MDLFDLIQSQLFNQNTMEHLASETQAKPSQVETLTKLALPAMLEALRKNASDEEGKMSLERALEDHQQDPTEGVLDFLRGADEQDGEKILNHMFGGNKRQVEESLAATSGLDIGSVVKLLAKYAPMILSMLALSKMGKQKQPAPRQTQQPKSGFDLKDILGDITGQSQQQRAPQQKGGFDLNDILGDLTGRAKTQAQQTDGGLMDSLKDVLGGFLK